MDRKTEAGKDDDSRARMALFFAITTIILIIAGMVLVRGAMNVPGSLVGGSVCTDGSQCAGKFCEATQEPADILAAVARNQTIVGKCVDPFVGKCGTWVENGTVLVDLEKKLISGACVN
jgi:hypothetical protein